ncbi:probable 26S proteasome non-ATPase regulatory subunit 3 [Aristolochia californica]|uniref:probable 26S proteasome non-ATPase regulatory subunit 3 n=1 Tax=Aristolochia californica TaxID=171875 RepID=UPI0035E1DE4E
MANLYNFPILQDDSRCTGNLQLCFIICSNDFTEAYAKGVRPIFHAVRLTISLRRKLKTSIVSAFLVPGSEAHSRLTSYLPKAVRIGDLELFTNVAENFGSTFSSDRTQNLIVRLRHNVIRTGLQNISISYSRISLIDVAGKLRLDSSNPVADAESIVAKAIRDGAIDATLDHASGFMLSKGTGDVYSTLEPQTAFNSRIAFCLNMHNEAVKALRFPPNSHKKEKESAEKRRERQQKGARACKAYRRRG